MVAGLGSRGARLFRMYDCHTGAILMARLRRNEGRTDFKTFGAQLARERQRSSLSETRLLVTQAVSQSV